MSAGRRLYLGLHLLDRQLVDRRDRLVGKVDDVELDEDPDGRLIVTALLSGPGVLSQRLHLPWGAWTRRVDRLLAGTGSDPARIPFARVSAIGSRVALAAEQEELATDRAHEWVADHVIRRIPGGAHAPE